MRRPVVRLDQARTGMTTSAAALIAMSGWLVVSRLWTPSAVK